MTKITRRDFITSITALTLANGVMAVPRSDNQLNLSNQSCFNELCDVLLAWNKQQIISPMEYLIARGADMNDSGSIQRLSREDFVSGELFEVKGLLLAKTEAAAIALMTERLTS